jgi:HAD superfamily hydrolase (TIGR01509 family)
MASVRDEVEAAGVLLGADFPDRWNEALPALLAQGVDPIPHVRELVELVRGSGIAYCVASSARVTKMNITLGVTGMLPWFKDRMFSASMVARGKPFPDVFLYAARTMGFAPSDCVVIEDSVAGTQAGVAAGMPVYSYAGDPMADREGLAAAGGMVFDDMRELTDLLYLTPREAFVTEAEQR